ncbi:MAG: XRE family transcriptional regulator [Rhodocyclaceae bacterium]|nr:MAG: XRE family transcriptional regulator [Rhodocyclaceae bacterium]
MPRKKKNQENGLGARIGQNIKLTRARLGMTQAKLAELIGVEVETMSRIETGVQLPSLERLDEIASALRLPLTALLSEGKEVDHPLQAVMDGLPKHEREFIYAFAMNYAQHWRLGAERKER